jgi:Tat protein translocase TatB subunit
LFGIGGSEILIIAIIVLLLFGPDKLPQAARTMGRFMREFKRYQSMMESTFKAEMYLSEQKAQTDKAGKTAKADEEADTFKKAREYRGKAGIVAPGETPPVVVELEDDEDAPIAPEDAGWTPGSGDAPGMEPVDDGEGEGEQQ